MAATRSAFAESVRSRERRQRHEPRRAGDRRHDELVEVVEHRAREELAERTRVALVGAAERVQVAGAVALVDDRRRDPEPDEEEVQDQAARSPVAVEERMDLLEAGVEDRERLGDRSLRLPSRSALPRRSSRASRPARRSIAGGCMPPGNGSMSCSRNEPGPSRSVACGCGATSQTGVIASAWTWRTSASEIRSPSDHAPGWRPVAVNPVGGRGVAADLEVLAQLLVADRSTLGEEELDLLEDERVALDRGRVMRLLEPDAAPDAFGLERRRQPAETLAQLADLDPQPLVDRRARRSASPRVRDFVRLRHILMVPNTLGKCTAMAIYPYRTHPGARAPSAVDPSRSRSRLEL